MSSKQINTMIQQLLKEKKMYSGPIDGVIGAGTMKGIEKLIRSVNVNASGWTETRKIVAASQILYRHHGIETGIVDGYMGPSTQDARQIFLAKISANWRDVADSIIKVEKLKVVVPAKTGLVKPMRTWPRQSGVSSFYGRPGANQVKCQLPFTMVLAWDTKTKLNSYSCHKLVKEPMERIWNRTLDHYGLSGIHDLRLHHFGGCLNVRKVRGGSSMSMHSWGIAVDIDPNRNQLRWGRDKAQLAKPAYDKFWQFVYDEGAISFGKERNYDWMHFQFAKL